MKSPAQPRSALNVPHPRGLFRPQVEILEDRLTPGDALTGCLPLLAPPPSQPGPAVYQDMGSPGLPSAAPASPGKSAVAVPAAPAGVREQPPSARAPRAAALAPPVESESGLDFFDRSGETRPLPLSASVPSGPVAGPTTAGTGPAFLPVAGPPGGGLPVPRTGGVSGETHSPLPQTQLARSTGNTGRLAVSAEAFRQAAPSGPQVFVASPKGNPIAASPGTGSGAGPAYRAVWSAVAWTLPAVPVAQLVSFPAQRQVPSSVQTNTFDAGHLFTGTTGFISMVGGGPTSPGGVSSFCVAVADRPLTGSAGPISVGGSPGASSTTHTVYVSPGGPGGSQQIIGSPAVGVAAAVVQANVASPGAALGVTYATAQVPGTASGAVVMIVPGKDLRQPLSTADSTPAAHQVAQTPAAGQPTNGAANLSDSGAGASGAKGIGEAGLSRAQRKALALGMRYLYPDLTDEEIAQAAGVSRRTLFRWEEYNTLKKAQRELWRWPHGHKDADGNLEAWEDPDE